MAARKKPVTGDGEAGQDEAVANTQDGAPPDAGPAQEDQPDTASDVDQETQPSASEEGSAMGDVLAETAAASAEAEDAMEQEGVRSTRRSRKAPSREELVKAAKRQREIGRKMLARKSASGFSIVSRQVNINNAALASAFERMFPVIDRCAHLVSRHGESVLGARRTATILEHFASVSETLDESRRDLNAAREIVFNLQRDLGDAFVEPSFAQPAFSSEVQVHSPHALQILSLFDVLDNWLTEAEVMYWNNQRTVSERNEAALQAKRKVSGLFTFAARTTTLLYRTMNKRNQEPSAANEAGGEGDASVEAAAVA